MSFSLLPLFPVGGLFAAVLSIFPPIAADTGNVGILVSAGVVLAIVVVDTLDAVAVSATLTGLGEQVHVIGHMVPRTSDAVVLA